jgi:hypothetical protein
LVVVGGIKMFSKWEQTPGEEEEELLLKRLFAAFIDKITGVGVQVWRLRSYLSGADGQQTREKRASSSSSLFFLMSYKNIIPKRHD